MPYFNLFQKNINFAILNIIRSIFIVIVKGLIITIFEHAVATVHQRVALST